MNSVTMICVSGQKKIGRGPRPAACRFLMAAYSFCRSMPCSVWPGDEVDLVAGVDPVVAVGAAFGQQFAGRFVATGEEGKVADRFRKLGHDSADVQGGEKFARQPFAQEFSLDIHQFNSSRVREKLSMKCSTK